MPDAPGLIEVYPQPALVELADAPERLPCKAVKIREKDIAPTLLNTPPSKQVLSSDRTLDWEEGTSPQNVQELFGAVRRVRNNLVHGGKSGDEVSDRNDALVAEAIEVLKEALRWHDDLRSKFEGRIPQAYRHAPRMCR